MGLLLVAFAACKLTVNRAINKEKRPVTINIKSLGVKINKMWLKKDKLVINSFKR